MLLPLVKNLRHNYTSGLVESIVWIYGKRLCSRAQTRKVQENAVEQSSVNQRQNPLSILISSTLGPRLLDFRDVTDYTVLLPFDPMICQAYHEDGQQLPARSM